ncbi:MAG: MFS transporter [Polymorphobacter sp.]
MAIGGSASTDQPPQHRRFLLLYALAWAGGAIAYVPLLTVLLPVRMTMLTGDQDVLWVAYATIAGAIAASLANIAFGWASDLSRDRRGWIAAGLALTLASLIPIAQLPEPRSLIVALVVWQVGLNMMLAPLAAWAADTVPDQQKGLLGGLLAFAPATGALAGVVVTIPGLADGEGRIGIIAAMLAATVLPVLLVGRPVDVASTAAPVCTDPMAATLQRRTLLSMWVARLAIQTAEGTLFAYLFFFFRAVDPGFRDADAARIFSVVLLVAAPLALATGRWVDRSNRPIVPLIVCAGLAALGLATMASATGLLTALGGYVVFGLGATIFLALHSSQTMRVLPRPDRRGRDLGLFNLTNTLPSLWIPSLAMIIVPQFGFLPLMWLLAGMALAACLLLVSLARLS